jgi:hypothetical protein
MRELIEKMEKKSGLDKFKEKHGIVSQGNAIGFSEKEQKWYGWSHRAIHGFGSGDKIFQANYGDDNTLFKDHGKKPIKNKYGEKAAIAFAKYVS